MPLDSLCILSSSGELLLQCAVNTAATPVSMATLMGVSSCLSMMRGATAKANAEGDTRDAAADSAAAAAKDSDGAATAAASSSAESSASGLCSVSVGGHKFVSLDVLLSSPASASSSASSGSSGSAAGCSCTLLAQGPGDESDAYLGSMLQGVREILTAYLGQGVVTRSSALSASSAAASGADDTECSAAIRGLRDLITHYVQAAQTDLALLVGGARWVHMEEETRLQIDRVLAQLEESAAGRDGSSNAAAAAAGSELTGTMLVLGGSILHSRMSPLTSRLVLQHLSCRPLGPGAACKLRTLPLYVGGVWQHFLMLRLRHLTLVVSAPLRSSQGSCNLARLSSLLLSWEDQFMESAAASLLPTEEAPVLLRHYTGHDTIAFLYVHHATGVSVAPPPRNSGAPGSSVLSAQAGGVFPVSSSSSTVSAAQKLADHVNQQEVAKTMQVFHWFYARAKSVLRPHASRAAQHVAVSLSTLHVSSLLTPLLPLCVLLCAPLCFVCCSVLLCASASLSARVSACACQSTAELEVVRE